MVNVSKMLVILAFLLILFAIILKAGNVPLGIGEVTAKRISLLIVANTSLLLAILLKK